MKQIDETAPKGKQKFNFFYCQSFGANTGQIGQGK